MSLMIKFFAFLLVLGFAGLFVLKDKNGQALLSLESFSMATVRQWLPSKQSIADSVKDISPKQILMGSDDASQTAVYRWKDAQGNWQFSDTAPAAIDAEKIVVSTDLNRDLAPPKPAKPISQTATSGKAIFIGDSEQSSPSIGTTVAPNKIEELIDSAKNVQGLMDDRDQQIQDILKQ